MSKPRIMIAAAGSGQGKTTVTCALLMALKRRGLDISAFKCGPDYIDPMFHREVLGIPSRNLDIFLAGENAVKSLIIENSGSDISAIEGVMGFYDGLGGITDEASSWHLADITDTPVVLVINPKGMSLTLAAVVSGLREFRENSHIVGIILNQCTPHLYEMLSQVIERETNLPTLGYLPPMPEITLGSRHLGLITAQEQKNLTKKLNLLADKAEQTIDLDRLLSIAATAPTLSATNAQLSKTVENIRIAVAKDEAFCFYYEENLDVLKKLGAEMVFFSPMHDEILPPDIAGLYLGGGYPEVYAEKLMQNESIRLELRQKITTGIPTIAECGGFMYLHDELEGEDGKTYAMAGVIDGKAFRTSKLQRFGYVNLTSQTSGFLEIGESITAHEFHYWDSTNAGNACVAQKPVTASKWQCMHQNANLFAGFPHIYFSGNLDLPKRFLHVSAKYIRSHQ